MIDAGRVTPRPDAPATTTSQQGAPVAISGAGQVGLAVALGLARAGVRSVVVEKNGPRSAFARDVDPAPDPGDGGASTSCSPPGTGCLTSGCENPTMIIRSCTSTPPSSPSTPRACSRSPFPRTAPNESSSTPSRRPGWSTYGSTPNVGKMPYTLSITPFFPCA
ncbi:MAG: FAD-dependent monooxygenase [Candidatus Dormibacteria bacterium]